MDSLSNDAIAQVDLLGREKFAHQIVTAITRSFEPLENSMAIGIAGRWGSGKSTLLSFIQKNLSIYFQNDADKYRIIHFNPWANSETGTEDLQRTLLETIIKELEKVNWATELKKSNNVFKNYLKYLEYIKFLKHVHPVAEKITDAIQDYIKQTSIASPEELKTKVDALIKKKGIKIFVFIDDLDRLSPNEIISIFKLIKLNVNFTHTCFIIAYDKEIVINSLQLHYGKNAETYLEKIIQADFFIPEIKDEEIENIFFSKLKSLFSTYDLPFNEQQLFSVWKYHGVRENFKTLRDIKRYFNGLVFSLPGIASEVNLIDFIMLEVMKVFDFKAYENVYQKYLSIRREAAWSDHSFDQKTIEEFDNNTTKALLKYLFTQNTRYAMGSNQLNEKRLKQAEYFERYYTLSISSKDVTEETLSLFFARGSNRKNILKDAVSNGTIKNLLRRLSDTELSNTYTNSDPLIFAQFMDYWDENHIEIISDIDELIWNAYFNLAHNFQDKFTGAQKALEALIIQEHEPHHMKMVFNHFLLLIQEERRSDNQLYGDVKNQVDIAHEDLKAHYKKYLGKQGDSYFYMAVRGNNSFLANLGIYSFARFLPEFYQQPLERHLSNPVFLASIVKNNFLMFEAGTKNPGRLNLTSKETLLPGDYWEKFLKEFTTIPATAWNEYDRQCIDFFIKSLFETR